MFHRPKAGVQVKPLETLLPTGLIMKGLFLLFLFKGSSLLCCDCLSNRKDNTVKELGVTKLRQATFATTLYT